MTALVLLAAGALLLATACQDDDSNPEVESAAGLPSATPPLPPAETVSPTPVPPESLDYTKSVPGLLPVGYAIETLSDGLSYPTSIAAIPDGRLLITEQQSGKVRVFQDGVLLPEPWFEVPVRIAEEEAFLQELGLDVVAVDPKFEENRYVYLYFTERRPDGVRQTTLARLRDVDGHGSELTRLITIELVSQRTHIAGGIAFQGDDAILIGIGDHEDAPLAQDLSQPVGKILRIDREGNPIADNPFVDDPNVDPRVYAYGFRNPFGITIDPVSGRTFVTENRDVVGDAVYELVPGANYGWPDYLPAMRLPYLVYEDPHGMAGITTYYGDALPEFDGGLFFCSFNQGGLLHWSDTGELFGYDKALRDRVLTHGCSSGLTVGTDGYIYFLAYFDGRLARIRPAEPAVGDD
jgi:glucose/arabinose dehydrogenase